MAVTRPPSNLPENAQPWARSVNQDLSSLLSFQGESSKNSTAADQRQVSTTNRLSEAIQSLQTTIDAMPVPRLASGVETNFSVPTSETTLVSATMEVPAGKNVLTAQLSSYVLLSSVDFRPNPQFRFRVLVDGIPQDSDFFYFTSVGHSSALVPDYFYQITPVSSVSWSLFPEPSELSFELRGLSGGPETFPAEANNFATISANVTFTSETHG